MECCMLGTVLFIGIHAVDLTRTPIANGAVSFSSTLALDELAGKDWWDGYLWGKGRG